MSLTLPVILDIPDKLLPIITDFNDYRFFLLEGGRGGGKSQAVARFLLYLADTKPNLFIMCGREIQNKISESVHAMLASLVKEFNLNFEILETKIRHRTNGSEFHFRGFIDRGVTNARGIENYNIVWIDEAQQISKNTVDDLVPTIIRKSNAKLFFTMNRFIVDDAVYQNFAGDPDCLHININYYDNPFCSDDMKAQAEKCRLKSEKDYKHIWLGLPRATASDYLFNHEKLRACLSRKPYGDLLKPQRVLGIDFAAQGDDYCVASVLDRRSSEHWELAEQIRWDEPDTTVSVGKIISLVGRLRPDVTILDVGGGGHNVHCDLTAAGLTVHRFDGGSTLGVNTDLYANQRAAGYWTLKDWTEDGFLIIPQVYLETVKQLEKIREKYRTNGTRLIQAKLDMKKDLGFSPDEADSVMMAVYAATKYLGNSNSTISRQATQITRKTNLRKGFV